MSRTWAARPLGEPWLSFLLDVERALGSPITLHCVGGFAVTTLVDMPRVTGDVDFIEVFPERDRGRLLGVAGEDSELALKHSLYIKGVGIVGAPHDYESRLIEVTPSELKWLRLYVLDPYDLILTKAQRALTRDLGDSRVLVEQLNLDARVLQRRFEDELLPYLAVAPKKTLLTVDLWMEELF